MYCKKCGMPLENGAKFCSRCGTPAELPAPQPEAPAARSLALGARTRSRVIVPVLAAACVVLLAMGLLRVFTGTSKPVQPVDPNALFVQGYLLVEKRYGYTFVDENGQYPFPDPENPGEPKIYLSACPFGPNGKTIVSEQEGSYYVMDANGKQTPIDLTPWYEDGYGYQQALFLPFDSSGLARFVIPSSKEPISRLWGLVNEKGEVVVEPRYSLLTQLNSNGKALALKGDSWQEIQLCLLDEKGKETPLDTQAMPLNSPYAFVGAMEQENMLEAIDLSTLDPTDLDSVRMGYLTPDGEWAIQPAYTRCGSFSQGRAWVCDESGCYFIDTTGARVSDIYDGCGDFTKDGLALVMREDYRGDSRYGYIDLQGNEVVAPQYAIAEQFSNGRALVSREHLSGCFYIDSNGTPVTPEQYSYSSGLFSESGLAPVLATGYSTLDSEIPWDYIDLNGNVVLSQRVYRGDWDNDIPGNFDPALGIAPACLEENGPYRLINRQGYPVGDATFDSYYTTRGFLKTVYGYDPWYDQSMY